MMKKTLAVIVFAAALSGCARQTFTLNTHQTVAPQQVTTHHFFVGGIGQQKTLDAAAVCGGQTHVERVEVQQTLVNGLLSLVTLGIYTPREARVYCQR